MQRMFSFSMINLSGSEIMLVFGWVSLGYMYTCTLVFSMLGSYLITVFQSVGKRSSEVCSLVHNPADQWATSKDLQRTIIN